MSQFSVENIQKAARGRRNHTGHRVGGWHHRAKLTDDDVRLIRILNAEGIGYRKLAEKFECGQSTVRDICTYRTRPIVDKPVTGTTQKPA